MGRDSPLSTSERKNTEARVRDATYTPDHVSTPSAVVTQCVIPYAPTGNVAATIRRQIVRVLFS